MGNRQGKIWGSTTELLKTPLVEFHAISISAGMQCSMHKHEHKWNGFYVTKGRLYIHVRKNNYNLIDTTVLNEGDFTMVKPGEFHRFEAATQVEAVELYWPEMLSEDIVREDVGGEARPEGKASE